MEGFRPINKQPNQTEENSLKPLEERILERESYVIKLCKQLLFKAGKSDMAEEIANDVLFKAVSKAARYDSAMGSLDTWLSRITRNAVIDYIRESNRNPTRVESKRTVPIEDYNTPDSRLNPEELMIKQQEREILYRAIEKLPPELRTAIMMDINELTYEEMAEKLKIPLGTLKSRLSRARENLARLTGQNPDNFKLRNSKKAKK